MQWRLGIDLGTNSLGWAAIELAGTDPDSWHPVGILASGARIFSDGRDPKSKQSLAVDRREARAMRRRRDRFQQRQRALMKYLVADGLFPSDPVERKALAMLDPFELRARALEKELSLREIGRAIWHLNQRRGFKSNRKTDKPDDDAGKVAVGVERLRTAMADAGADTFGQWLHMRRQPDEEHPEGLSVRTRLRAEAGEDAKGTGYDFYPGRALIEEEFNAIWATQAPHHPDVLTDEVRDRLFEIVFHQRPLKAPQIGTCTLVQGETRLAKAHPLFQRRRLLEELNALRIVRAGQVAERLTPEQRDLLFVKLKDKAKVSFESLRKVLKLDDDARFNKESENRRELKGDEVAAVMGAKTRFAGRWAHLSVEEQAEIVERLEDAESDAQIAGFRVWVGEIYGLSDAQTAAIAAARLPQGHGRFGSTATSKLIEALRDGRDADGRVVVYSEAVDVAGLGHHSDFRTGEVHDALPYYGAVLERHIMPGTGDASDLEEKRVGKLTNPTVHIGLNQLRRTVNRLIERFGLPTQIAVELARELKLTEDEKDERNRENRRNREDAERRSRKLLGLDAAGNQIGRKIADDTGANRALLKLWEELDGDNVLSRACVYTGRQISIDMLFNGEAEVDHILPFAATLDDSNGNKIVCVREANRAKGKQSPFKKWGDGPEWAAIAERASRLPKNKRWRFEPDAMQRFDKDGGFLARQLIDTQYLARLARDYLSSLYPETGPGSGRVWVSPGRLTEMVRRKLGLNTVLNDHNYGGDKPKNRLDHRHHAIDAIVIAIVDRPLLNLVSRISGQQGADGREKIEIPPPWDGFRGDVYDAVQAIVVSHRPDHGTAGHGVRSTAGRLHEATAYGLTGEVDAKGNTIVVRRKAFRALTPPDITTIRDPDLRDRLLDHIAGKTGKDFERALQWFARNGPGQFRDIRRVRVVKPLSVIPIRDGDGRAYKGYAGGSNYSYDVWEMPDGKWVVNWTDPDGVSRSSVLSMFDAHQPRTALRPHPAARRVLQLKQGDLIAIERTPGDRRIMRVSQFWQNGQVRLVEHMEAGKLDDRHKSADDPYTNFSPTCGGLKKLRARKVGVDETGYVRDPGFPARTAVRRTRPKPA